MHINIFATQAKYNVLVHIFDEIGYKWTPTIITKMNKNWQKSCKIYRFTEFTTFKLKSLALKVAKSLAVFYTLRAGHLSKGGCLRSSALWFNSYPLSRFHWFLEMLRVLHVLKFEIFKHLIYVTTFTGFELKNSFKVENKN